MKPTLLVVEDDAEIRAMLAALLGADGYHVEQAGDAAGCVQLLAMQSVDLVILDLGLPDEDGLSLCRKLRARSEIPVIMLTARGDPLDRITGLEIGADDYLCKPFEPRELLARIRNILRRRSATPKALDAGSARKIGFGRWTLDTELRRLIDSGGRAVILSATEFRLLRLLIDHAGDILSRERILELGGSHSDDSMMRSVDLRISRIRIKLNDFGPPFSIIATERGQGYCFIAPIRWF